MIKQLLLLYCLIFSICSCDKIKLSDNPPDLQLKISQGFVSSDAAISAGSQYNIDVLASSKNGENLTNLIVESNGQRLFDKGYNQSKIEEVINLTKSMDDKEILSFIVFNKARKSDTLTIVISKFVASFSPITRYKNIVIGAQSNTNLGNYFSLSSAQIFTQNEAFTKQQLIDMIYFFDPGVDANTLASPGANLSGIITGTDSPENWSVKRTIRYSRSNVIIKDKYFDNALNDSLIIANMFSDGGRKAEQLQNNQYYVFQTNENKFGIIKIENVTGQATGSLQFSLIVQQ